MDPIGSGGVFFTGGNIIYDLLRNEGRWAILIVFLDEYGSAAADRSQAEQSMHAVFFYALCFAFNKRNLEAFLSIHAASSIRISSEHVATIPGRRKYRG